MLVLNDIHLGVVRKGGTTPASQEAMRSYLFSSFENALHDTTEKGLMIVGDLFDTFEVSPRDWLQTYQILQDWCVRFGRLILVAGNHDWSPKGARVSSFQMLCDVLLSQFGPDFVQVVGIDQYACVDENLGLMALAHCSNQDVFNAKLAEVLAGTAEGDRVFLHANYDNNFAAVSDHSLNVSADQARLFNDKGVTLYFAHEHQAKRAMKGGVMIMGNQWPTSIADCLNNDSKFAHVVSDEAVTPVETWMRDGLHYGYAEIEWRELATSVSTLGFVKVVGEALSSEAAEVINVIAKFRQTTTALVVSNGVKVDGIVEAEALPESFEVAKAFDVMAFIKANVTDDEFAAVEKLREPA